MEGVGKLLKNKLHSNYIAGAGKGKGGGDAGGDVALVPPPASDLFQSISYMQTIDLLCEGPIYGLVTREGKKTNGLKNLEAVYYNNNPIKEPTQTLVETGLFLGLSSVQMMDRFTTTTVQTALDNISGNIVAGAGFGYSGKFTEISSAIGKLKERIVSDVDFDNTFFANFGFIQFNTSGALPSGKDIKLRNQSQIFVKTFYGDSEQTRFTELKNSEAKFEVPDDFYIVSPRFITGTGVDFANTPSGYFPAPSGQVGTYYLNDNFIGGGLLFFNIGDNVATGSNGAFDTGKFLVSASDSNLEHKLRSGIENEHDVLIYDSNNSISFGVCSKQVSPSIGETVGKKLSLAFLSDKDEKFNYTNADIVFRNGGEFQSEMSSYSRGSRQINVGNNLLGPFRLEGSADAGLGNEDGGFATWQESLPVPHDDYAYNHLIEQREVDKVIPTISILKLNDTQAAGEGVGRTIPEFVEIRVDQGFEGDDFPLLYDEIVTAKNLFTLSGEAGDQQGVVYATFKMAGDGVTIDSFLEGSGSIRLRNPSTSNLDSVNVGSDLTVFGFSSDQSGKLFTNIKDMTVESHGANYTGILNDLRPEVVNYGVFTQDVEWNNAFQVVDEIYQIYTGTGGGDLDHPNLSGVVGLFSPGTTTLVSGTSGVLTGDGTYGTQENYRAIISGAIHRDTDFGGGLLVGSYEIDGVLFDEDPEITFDIPDVDKVPANRVEKSLEQGISPRAIFLAEQRFTKEFRFEGIVASPYLTELGVDDLPDNKVLKGATVGSIEGMTSALATQYNLDTTEVLFPGETWKDVNRFQRVSKKTHETESVLISRDIALSYVTEYVDRKFTYPFSAMVGNTIDARTFLQPPERTFDVRLKKVAIPSNYVPLKPDGIDKRFVDSSENYGLRDIQTFNGSTYIKVADKIDLGTENYEMTFKVKFGSFNASTTPVYFIDVDGGNLNTPGRIAVYHRDNGGGSSPEIGMVGKDDAGNTDFLDKDISISAYSVSDVFTVSLKAVGSQYTLTVKVGETLVGTQTGTLTNRPSFSYDPSAGTSLLIGSSTTHGSSSFLDNGTQIVDFKIKKNNQLLHHWDGTIIDTTRLGDCFKDRFGGNHGEIVGTANAVEDTDFKFGKNKEQVYVGEWDGTFRIDWTDNPAWILYDIMTHPTQGLGLYLDDIEDVDIFHLYEIGRYCDAVDDDGYFDGVADSFGGLEPRFSANFILTESTNAFEVVGNIASLFRGITYWNGGFFNFAVDKPKGVSAIFNNGNVFDGIFNYADIASTARYTKVEVPYIDKDDDFKVKVEYAEDEERMRKYGRRVNEQNGFATTSKSQAKRMGKYILLSNQFETESIAFQAGQEALLLAPGDIIRVDDEIKNFEINYGKVLGVNTGEGYVDLEKSFKTGSVLTGSAGGLYLYNSREQQEIKDLYDLINFNQTVNIGEDSDLYSGVVPLDKIDQMDDPLVTRYYITGIQSNTNSHRVYVDQSDTDYQYFNGTRVGSFFNATLNNQVSEFYKVIKISESENNLYEVQGLQYETGKFEAVERGDFDIVENNYNIGIVENEINRPPAPVGFNSSVRSNTLGGYEVFGVITGEAGGAETKYRVSLIFPNGRYLTQDFLKDDSQSPPETSYIIRDLTLAGNYEVSVTSLRNPESSKKLNSSIYIPKAASIRQNFIFSDINVLSSSSQGFTQLESGSWGVANSTAEDVTFAFKLEDMEGEKLSFSNEKKPYVRISTKTDNGFVVLEDNIKKNSYTMTKTKIISIFGSAKRSVETKFEILDKEGRVHDSCKYTINNSEPFISSANLKETTDRLKFNLNLSQDAYKDINKISIFRSENHSSGYSLLETQFVDVRDKNIDLTIDKSNFSGSQTGYYFYKFLPFDAYGQGRMSEPCSGAIEITPSAEESLNQLQEQIDFSIVSVYLAQGTGSSIINSTNNTSGIYLQSLDRKNNPIKYISELNAYFDCVGTGSNYFNISGLDASGNLLDFGSINFDSTQKRSYSKLNKTFVNPSNEGPCYFIFDNKLTSGTSVSFNFEIQKVSQKL